MEKEIEALLSNINGYKLDYEQRNAVICNAQNILLIAGAGSGKTLTIIGKIRYLIEIEKYNSQEILCISFTNNAVNNLKSILKHNYNYNVNVYTFHKLGLNILKDNNRNIKVCSKKLLDYIIDEYFSIIKIKQINKLNKKELSSYKNLIKKFIHIFKANNLELNKFSVFFNESNTIFNLKRKSDNIFLYITYNILKIYEDELKSKCEIDFDDMVNLCTNLLKKNKDFNYKYIIIDEYQDTSLSKLNFIKKLINCGKAKLMVVGDDFQSIYQFTGCDLNIFLSFHEHFKNCKVLKIQKTYRNSKELIEVAGNFVMKNRSQIYKYLESDKSLIKPIKIVYCKNNIHTLEQIIIKLINFNYDEIMILGRNNADILDYIDNNIFIISNNLDIIYLKNKSIHIKYMTIHKSKGLESQNVIIINLENKIYGFPNKMENDKILQLVLNKKQYYPFEEERRLFYVALTRTKNYVYLITTKTNPSIFIKEIIKDYKKQIEVIKF